MLVPNEILNAKEAAELLKLNERTVKRMADNGELPGFQLGNRWRFRREALEDFIRQKERQNLDRERDK